MAIELLQIGTKIDSPAKQRLIAERKISENEMLSATEINEWASKTNDIINYLNKALSELEAIKTQMGGNFKSESFMVHESWFVQQKLTLTLENNPITESVKVYLRGVFVIPEAVGLNNNILTIDHQTAGVDIKADDLVVVTYNF